MKIRFPLYAKGLLWFGLNLLFLLLVFYAFFKVQFQIGVDSLLLGRTADRVQAVSEIIRKELAGAPVSEWDSVLQYFNSVYKVTFLLFRGDGSQMAGAPTTVPPEVLRHIEVRRGPPAFAGRGPPPGRGPPNWQGGGGPAAGPPRFMLRTDSPTRYWVGVRMPPPGVEAPRPGPMVLVAMSHSLWGGGLFFDLTPWVAVAAAVVLVSVLFWFPLVRGVTRSISELTRATDLMAQGRFDARVDARRRDELGRLGEAVNQMAARLDGFVSGQKRFLGDIAHELCSPIARMQVALGILEQRTDEKQKAYVADVQEEVQQMSGLVNELLSFSKASLEPASVKLQPVNLGEMVARAIHREAGAGDRIQVEIPAGQRVLAEPELLVRALANLVRNAVRYAGHAGPITISSRGEREGVTLTIADCGPGVPEESVSRLFDPFYRPELSRSAETGGAGLGLAIVKTCVESCQGTVSCRNRSPSGLEVTVRLKAASAS